MGTNHSVGKSFSQQHGNSPPFPVAFSLMSECGRKETRTSVTHTQEKDSIRTILCLYARVKRNAEKKNRATNKRGLSS